MTEIVFIIAEAIRKGKKVLICGNGGLAAEAEHFAAELMGTFAYETYASCIALTTNSALITAIANDMGFENVFSHQVNVLGQEGDVLIGMTTSASVNILRAMEAGRERRMRVFLLDRNVWAGDDTAEIQNEAIKFLHKLALEVKEILYRVNRQSQ